MADKPKIDKLNRGRELSRAGDPVKSISVGFMDIDKTIFYYFDNVIKPIIKENGEIIKVPIIYSNPEKWAAIQKQGFIRDNKNKVMAPVVAFRRTSFSKDDTIPVDKLNPMDPKLHMTFEKRYSKENRYDKLTALKGITPKRELYSVAVPDYVNISYDFIVWTNFTDQMNEIVEKINWNEGSYWGEPGKFRFRATIDSFDDASEYEDTTRRIKTSFSLSLRGYLLPDEYPPTAVNTQKFITPKQIVINDNTDMNITQLTSVDDEGAKTINVINNMGMAAGGGGAGGGSVEPLTIVAGDNMLFDSAIFSGVSSKTVTIASSPTPSFNTVSTTGNLTIGGGITSTGNIITSGDIIAEQYIVSSSISIITQSFSSGSTIFGDTTDDTHLFTGSLDVKSQTTSSTAISATNVQNGYPTSNKWQQSLNGSYFNNFDNTTHVSEILRFMAGVLSHSLDVADASPNSKTFGSVDTNENNLGNTDSISGYIPTNYGSISNNTLDYLVNKGFGSVGSTIFNGISVYHDNGNSHFVDLDSNSSGTTQVTSSADTELFGLGLLSSGAATEFKVRVNATHSFSDNASNTAPNESSNTHTTQSILELSTTSFGTSNGLTLAKIVTSQPAVIPSAYQDAKFQNVGGTSQMSGSLSRKWHATKGGFTSVSSSGYYRFHGISIGIASGSSAYQFVNGSVKNRFWAPVDQIESDIGTNSLADSDTTHRALTATSRSLSGVPYMIDATYELSTKITGLFNPMYAASTTLVNMTAGSVGAGSVSISGDTVSTNGGTIQTSGKIFQSDGTTAVNSGVPRYNDIALITGSLSFDSGNNDNINQSGFSDTTFTVATTARNRNSSNSTLDTQTITYHIAGAFGQVAASGSLGIYGRAQGYDGGSLTGTTEQFSGEDFRIVLNNNVTSFSGTAWTTSYQIGGLIGNYDLQIKPGFLVDPGGSYRYWYPTNHGSGTYKYYIRRFQTSGTKTSLTINVGKTLVNWNSTTDGVAVGLILKSGTSSGGNTSITTCRLYDPSETTSNLIESGITADNHKNPFSSNIDLYGNTGGGISSTTYTVPIRNADGMFIDNTDNELYVIIRYKGDPSPVTSITISYS